MALDGSRTNHPPEGALQLDLDLSEEQDALRTTVRRWASAHAEATAHADRAEWPDAVWNSLGPLGVLGLGSEHGGGGMTETTVALLELGRCACPGPLAATAVAVRMLPEHLSEAVARGERKVTLADRAVGALVPWAEHADVILVVDRDRLRTATVDGPLTLVSVLDGGRWGRGDLSLGDDVGDAAQALSVHDLAVAALLVGAAERMIELASDYARNRTQFRRAIGDFQAVSHPLAQIAAHLLGARTLLSIAATRFDADGPSPAERAASARVRLSASAAAIKAVHQVHQAFGAMGFVLEGGLSPYSYLIRQTSLLPPGPAACRAVVEATIPTKTSAREHV